MSDSDIDLNIDNYNVDELLNMFQLDDPTEQDVLSKTNSLIDKARKQNQPKLAFFFRQAQDVLLKEFDKDTDALDVGDDENEQRPDEFKQPPKQDQGGDPEDTLGEDTYEESGGNVGQYQFYNKQNDSKTQIGQWWQNEYLRQKDPTQTFKYTDRKNKTQAFEGNQHVPLKREKLGVTEAYNVPVIQGVLNPNLKNTITRLVNLDSQYRQLIMPNSWKPNSPASPTNYTLDLSENLTNVLSIKLYSVQIPYTWYTIDEGNGTNCLFYKRDGDATYTTFSIPSGNYTSTQLIAALNVAPFNTIFDASYNPINGKTTITNTTGDNYTILFFDPTYTYDCSGNCGLSQKLNSNLGWILGYRGSNLTPQPPNTLIYYVTSGSSIISEAILDVSGPKYFLLVLDDYNQNHLNKGLVTIVDNPTRLSLPSYYTADQSYTCVNVDGQREPVYIPSSPQKLTQAQIYSLNQILENRNNTTKDRYSGPTTTDVLAIIPLKGLTTTGQIFTEYGSTLQLNERIYFGPVNIERMKIQLIDDKGNIVNLHGNDWCFSIMTTHLYEY